MGLQIRQDLRRILVCNLSLQFSFGHQRETMNDPDHKRHHEHHVENRLVDSGLIFREEIQKLRKQWCENDGQKKKKTNVSQSAIHRHEQETDIGEKPAAVANEGSDQKNNNDQHCESPTGVMKIH